MKDIFNKAGQIAKNTAEKAADKAGELVETGKLKAKISSAKTEIATLEKKIGQYYFEQYSNGVAIDAAAGALCEDIKAQQDLIAELEEKIEAVKAE